MPIDHAVAHLTADPARTALLLDYDGSLAQLVSDPATSVLAPGLDRTLTSLAQSYAVVAIISGRPVDYLLERIHVEGVLLDGLYGLQTHRDGVTRLHPDVEPWLPQVAQALERLESEVPADQGFLVENKGASVALHWRRTADHTAAEQTATELVTQVHNDTGLQIEPGKYVLELRPPVEYDKGAAVRALLAEYDLAAFCYLGDDLGDLPAFATVADRGGVTVLVDHGVETSDHLRTSAQIVLEGVDAAGDFLRRLADAAERTSRV